MGHITQCPHCSTQFRVVADQLKLSAGWVRCGQCGQAFNAQASRVDLVAAPPPPAEPTMPVAATAAEISTAASSEATETAAETPTTAAPASLVRAVRTARAARPPRSVPVTVSVELADPDAAVPLPAVVWPDGEVDILLEPDSGFGTLAPSLSGEADPVTAAVPDGKRLAHAVASKPLTKQSTKPRRKPAREVPEVSFVRKARRRAFWHRRRVRTGLALGALVLTFALAGQVLVHQRDRLAAAHPTWTPWLAAVCRPLGCQVNAWQAIDSVVIDSSALVRLSDNAYRFEVGFRNTSDLVLATPALELSLTNQRDEVVVRRVILATEWSVPTVQLLPQSTQTLSVQLALTQPEDLRMAGYRALVFYP